MLSIREMCADSEEDSTPRSVNSEPIKTSKEHTQPQDLTHPPFFRHDSAPPIILINKTSEPTRKRQRFTIEQRFEIIQELKVRKCSIKEIAAAYNTTPRNVWRWRVIYGPYDNLADAFLKSRLK
jgi:hypothetical protein